MMIYWKPMLAFVALGVTWVSGFTSRKETTATVAAIEKGECTVSADCADTVAGDTSESMAPEGGANYCCCEDDAVIDYTCDDCRGCVADNNDVSGECPAKCSPEVVVDEQEQEQEQAGSACVDASDAGVSTATDGIFASCAAALEAGACDDALYAYEMQTACPVTCGICPNGTFKVCDLVQRRDGTADWATGYVTQVSPLKVTVSSTDPSEEGFSWDEVRELEQHTFKVGDLVQRRDGTAEWRTGYVTKVCPLKVTVSEDPSGEGFSWDEVRAEP